MSLCPKHIEAYYFISLLKGYKLSYPDEINLLENYGNWVTLLITRPLLIDLISFIKWSLYDNDTFENVTFVKFLQID